MRVFISADMEGITGVATPEDVTKGEPEYRTGQELLHGDVNAAVDGALAGGADELLVNDAHWTMRNLNPEKLHDGARLIRGQTKPRAMMQGITPDHDVAFFVGYHAMAGTARGVLNHTVLPYEVQEMRVDDDPVGELGWNALLASHLGVPVGLVTGDDRLGAEATDVGLEAETVVVKEGIDRFTADCRPPSDTCPAIRQAAEQATKQAAESGFSVEPVTGPTTIETDWSTTNHSRAAAQSQSVERLGPRTTRVEASNYADCYASAVGMIARAANSRHELFG